MALKAIKSVGYKPVILESVGNAAKMGFGVPATDRPLTRARSTREVNGVIFGMFQVVPG
jgi:hypothetical protein